MGSKTQDNRDGDHMISYHSPLMVFVYREMGRAKKGPKFAVTKKLISSKTIKKYKDEILNPKRKDDGKDKLPRNVYVLFFCIYHFLF